MAVLFDPYFQAISADGIPFAGAKLYFYRSGTTSLVSVYADAGGGTPLTNPVIASAAGLFPPIYLSTTVPLKYVLKDADGVTILTVDRFEPLVAGINGNSYTVETAADLPVPSNEYAEGIVLADPDPSKNGYWYRSGGAWVFGRPFPDGFAKVGNWGGTANAKTAMVLNGEALTTVQLFFGVVEAENAGPMTLNLGAGAKAVVSAAGLALAPGEWTGAVLFFLNEDNQYQLVNDAGAAEAAAQSAAAAYAAQLAAEEAAAGAGVTDGDKGDVVVSGAGTVWTVPTMSGDAGAGGEKGLAPAPAAGDAAANKYLHADGTWKTVAAQSSQAPQGRLSVSSSTAVLYQAVAGATTIYYHPFTGDEVPIWNGTRFLPRQLGGVLSQALTDTTKSPAAAANNSNYDLFLWLDGSTLRCTRGPAWSTATTRGTGAGTSEIDTVQGRQVNKVAITNGPAAGYGTYVGTIRTNGSAQIDWSLGSGAAGGGIANLTVWNAFNQVEHQISVKDTTASWVYNTAAMRAMNGSNANRVNLIAGLGDGPISANLDCRVVSSGNFAAVTIGLDSTTAQAIGATRANCVSYDGSLRSNFKGTIGLGFHYLQALENTGGATQTFYSNGVDQALQATWFC